LQFDPSNADAQVNLGNVYKEKGLVDLAVGHYRKALDLNPNYV